MENLGEYLQQKREERNISIEELVSRTRIPVRFINAIEANDLDLLPNRVTAKGFLRSYAECVGVDHALITDAFSELQPPSDSFRDDRSRNEILSHVQVEKSKRHPFPRRIILSIVFLVCALLILVGFLSKKDKKVNTLSSVLPPQIVAPDRPDILETEIVSDEVSVSEEIVPEAELLSQDVEDDSDESERVLSEEPSEVVLEEQKADDSENILLANLPTSSDASEEGSEPEIIEETEGIVDVTREEEQSPSDIEVKEYVLSLEAIEASWVQVTIDGKEVREALLQPNDRVQWKANKKFRLTLGNAGGVRVKLDGQEIGPFGPSGEVIHTDILGESSLVLD